MGTLYTPPPDDGAESPNPADWVLPDDVFDATKWAGPIDPRPDSNTSQGLMQQIPSTFGSNKNPNKYPQPLGVTITSDRSGTSVTFTNPTDPTESTLERKERELRIKQQAQAVVDFTVSTSRFSTLASDLVKGLRNGR